MKQKFYTKKIIFNNRIFRDFRFLLFFFISLFTGNISAQTIGTVTVNPTPLCPGSQTTISFLVTNGNVSTAYFTTSTNYILYYNNGGGFNQYITFTSNTAPASSNGDTATISIPFTIPLAIATGTYRVSIGSTSPTFDGSTGINASAPFAIIANPTISYTKVFASPCHGGTDGSISVTATGGTAPYTYTWTGYPNAGSYSNNIADITGLAIGEYTIVVKDNNQCSATVPGIAIKQAPAVQVGVSTNSPSCAGNDGSINAFRIGGVYDGINPIQYKLDSTATFPYQDSGLFKGLTAGPYMVTAKDSKGCTGSTLVNLLADTRPAPTVGIYSETLPSCGQTNGSISAYRIGGVAEGTNPIQFKLDGAATVPYQNSGVFSGLAPGNYSVTVKDSRGCTGILAVNLTEDTIPAPKVGLYQPGNPGCSGNDGTISAYRVGGIYDGSSPIQFKLDGTATIPYQASGDFSGLSAGNYTVTVKDSRGCTGSTNLILTQAAPLVFTPNGYTTNVSSCGNGSDGAIVITVSGGVTPYHFSVNGVDQGSTSLLTFRVGNLASGNYNVVVTDSKGCSISESLNLIQVTAPVALIEYTGSVTCTGGSDGFITAWQSGGVSGYSYSKDGGSTYQDSYRFLNLSAGNYSVVVKDSKGCVSSPDTVTIYPGTKNCTTPRIGNNIMSNTSAENKVGGATERIDLSKPIFNSSLNVNAFPNPFSSEFTLEVKGNTVERVTLTVTDILGRRVSQSEGYANQQFKIGSNLKSGIYIVQVTQGSNMQTLKIVKE